MARFILGLIALIFLVAPVYAFTGDFRLNPLPISVDALTTTDFNIDTAENPYQLETDLQYVQHIVIETDSAVTGTVTVKEYPVSSPGDIAFSITMTSALEDALENVEVYVVGQDVATLTINQTKTESTSFTAEKVSHLDIFDEYFDIDSLFAGAVDIYSETTYSDNINENYNIAIVDSYIDGNVQVGGNLLIINSTITGNIKVTGGDLVIDSSEILGNIFIKDGDVGIRDSTINNNINLDGEGDSIFYLSDNDIDGSVKAVRGFLIDNNNNITGSVSGDYLDSSLWKFSSASFETQLFTEITETHTGTDFIIDVELANIGAFTAINPQVTLNNVPADWNVSQMTIYPANITSGQTIYTEFIIEKGPTDADVYVTAVADNADQVNSNTIRIPVFLITVLAIVGTMLAIKSVK